MSDTTLNDKLSLRLRRLGARLAQDAGYMAYALEVYRVSEQLNEEQLALQLHIDPKLLPRLYLCRRPGTGSARFASDICQIAAYVGAEHIALAGLIRQVEALEAFSGLGAGTADTSARGLLAAARDIDVDAERDSEERNREE